MKTIKTTYKTVSTLAATLIIFGSLAGEANAALTFTFSPDQDGFTAVTVSGSGVIDTTGTGSYSSTSAAAFSAISPSGSTPSGTDPALAPWDGTGTNPYGLTSNTAQIIIGGTTFSLSTAFIEDDGDATGDDFVFHFTNINTITSGNYTASGAARLLDTQNTFGNGANAPITFAGLTPGTYSDPTDNQSVFFGGVEIVVTNTPINLTVPEPSSTLLLGIGAIGILSHRPHRRKNK